MKKVKTTLIMSEEEFRKNFPKDLQKLPIEEVLSFAAYDLKNNVTEGVLLEGSKVEIIEEETK